MIETIMRNLISNSIKYSYSGGSIEVIIEEELSSYLISVSDHGVGIKSTALESLFRIDEGISTNGTLNETGTGLGLILCKEFVEKHGGQIWAESEPGTGSKFTVSLPIQENHSSKDKFMPEAV
jgi:signal transduction histidine kinase